MQSSTTDQRGNGGFRTPSDAQVTISPAEPGPDQKRLSGCSFDSKESDKKESDKKDQEEEGALLSAALTNTETLESQKERLQQATDDLSDVFESSDTEKQTEKAQRIAILNFINAYKAVREEESRYLSCWASICFFFCFARSFSRDDKLDAINSLSDALSSIGEGDSDKLNRLHADLMGNNIVYAPLKQGRLGQSLLTTYLEEYLNRHCPSQEEGDSKKSPRPAEYSAGTPILMAGRNGGYGTTGSINEISPGLSANS